MAKDKPFNNPFGALKAQAKPQPPQQQKAAAPAPKAGKPQQVSTDEESALFLSAMGAFDPVKPVRAAPPPAAGASQKQKAAAEDVESLLELAELVSGEAELSVEQTATSVLAVPKGFDVGLFGKLPPAASVELQALEPSAARQALERFIVAEHAKKARSVRVVTGQALRQAAVAALTQGKLARRVLAFSGGLDALEVLLRRGAQ